MKVISIGTDRNIFNQESAVFKRASAYAGKMENLFVIVFSLKKLNLKETNFSPNISIYPTNSFSRLLYFVDCFFIGRRIIKNNKLSKKDTIISCQDPFESGLAGLILAKFFKLNLHIQVHTDFLSQYFKYSFLQKIRVFLSKIVLPNANFIRVVSKRIYDSLAKSGIKFKGVIEILPIVVNRANFKYGLNLKNEFPGFSHYILIASRLEKEKRIEDAIIVFKNILNKFPQAGLFIAGDGREIKKLISLVESLDIKKNVFFLGFKSDLASTMESADVFLQTSAFEGYGISLVEAGLQKTPIVSTDVGIAEEILNDGKDSFVCPVSDIICLQSKLEKLLSDENLRRNFGALIKDNIFKNLITEDDYVNRYVKQLEKAVYDKQT